MPFPWSITSTRTLHPSRDSRMRAVVLSECRWIFVKHSYTNRNIASSMSLGKRPSFSSISVVIAIGLRSANPCTSSLRADDNPLSLIAVDAKDRRSCVFRDLIAAPNPQFLYLAPRSPALRVRRPEQAAEHSCRAPPKFAPHYRAVRGQYDTVPRPACAVRCAESSRTCSDCLNTSAFLSSSS